MIDYITGMVENVGDMTVTIECQGIGYLMSCSASTCAKLSVDNDDVKIYTYMSVSEQGISLYGFSDKLEREAFFRLTSVSKVGPKVALNILSVYSYNELASVIEQGDVSAMSLPSGVGKKLAENIIVNLKGKLTSSEAVPVTKDDEDDDSMNVKAEAISALTSLGYDRQSAFRHVSLVYSSNDTIESLIRKALESFAKER